MTTYYRHGKQVTEEEFLLGGLPRFVERLNNQSHAITFLMFSNSCLCLAVGLMLLGVL